MLRAAQVVVDEGIARPLLLGRADGHRRSASREYGLRLAPGRDCEFVDRLDSARVRRRGEAYYQLRAAPRRLADAGAARDAQPRHPAGLRCCVRQGEADAMLCGTFGR